MYTHPYIYTYISYTLISGTTGPQRVKLVSSTPRESEEKGANPSRAFFFFHHPPTATAPWEPRFSPPAMVPPPGRAALGATALCRGSRGAPGAPLGMETRGPKPWRGGGGGETAGGCPSESRHGTRFAFAAPKIQRRAGTGTGLRDRGCPMGASRHPQPGRGCGATAASRGSPGTMLRQRGGYLKIKKNKNKNGGGEYFNI